MRKVVAVCIALLLIGNEVISAAALCVICCIGVAKLLTAAAKAFPPLPKREPVILPPRQYPVRKNRLMRKRVLKRAARTPKRCI